VAEDRVGGTGQRLRQAELAVAARLGAVVDFRDRYGRCVVIGDVQRSAAGSADADVRIAAADAAQRDGDRLRAFDEVVVENGDVDVGGCLASQDGDRAAQTRVVAAGQRRAGYRVRKHRVGRTGQALADAELAVARRVRLRAVVDLGDRYRGGVVI